MIYFLNSAFIYVAPQRFPNDTKKKQCTRNYLLFQLNKYLCILVFLNKKYLYKELIASLSIQATTYALKTCPDSVAQVNEDRCPTYTM